MTLTAERRRALTWLWAPAVLALLAYATALCGEFVYDDVHSIAGNPSIRTLRNAGAFFTDPDLFSGLAGYRMYRPVLLLSYAVNYAIGWCEPFVFKLTNVLLHAATAVLLGLLARRWGASVRAAGIAACLFAVHPLCSEAVNLVSARSELLAVSAIVLGLHGHCSAMQGRRWGNGLAAFAAVLACGSKETSVMLPVLMLVQEWLWPAASWSGARVRAAVLRILPAALVVLVYLGARRELLGMATVELSRTNVDVTAGYGRDLPTQLCTMATLLPRALVQVLLPFGLSIDPPVSYHTTPDVSVLSGALALLLLSWFGLRHGRRRPLCTAGTALLWATALPWVLVPLNVPLAEHRLYGPLCGLCLCGAAAASRKARAWSWQRSRIAFAATAVALAFLAGWRSLDYTDECRLWQPVTAAAPANAHAWLSLGLAAQRHGDGEEARTCFARAVAAQPTCRRARQEWIDALLRLPEERQAPFLALRLVEELRRQSPGDPYPRIQQANAMIEAGNLTGEPDWYRKAETVALSCLEIAEKKGLVFRTAAEARRRLHDLPGAIAHLDRSIRLGLDHYSVRVDRGLLLLEAGRAAEARQELALCLKLAPMDPGVQELLRRCQPAGPSR